MGARASGMPATSAAPRQSRDERMDFFRRFTFLVCAPAFDADDLEGLRLGQITVAIEKLGFQVVRARRIEDAEIAVQTDAAIGCMVVDWGKKGLEGKTAALINLMRRRGLEMPIVMLVRRKRFEDIPVEVLDYIDGYIFLAEETPEFIATQPGEPAQAICRDAEDAVLRRAGRLCRARQPAVDLPRPQWRHLLQPQPDRPHLRRASRRGGVPRRPRQFGARAGRPADRTRARR